MKRWMKVLFCVMFSFLFCFLCVGYATLTDQLVINGTASVTEPTAVYITDIVETTGTVTEAILVPFTSVNSTIALGAGADSTVTMRISVKNNTATRYGFNAIRYVVGQDTYSNQNIEVVTDMTRKTVDNRGNVTSEGTVIEPGEIIEFTATFQYKENADTSDPTLDSIINYEFLPWDEITASVDAGVASDVLGYLQDVLNGDAPLDSEKYPDKTSDEVLTEKLDSGQASASGAYIANFDGATEEDIAFLNELFGETLHVNINGEDKDVKFIIKRENLIGAADSEQEITIYMTTHTLLREDATETSGWLFKTYYASPIYAAVFTKTDTGWEQVGDMYEGRAEINGYSGSAREGSLNTDTWESAKAYGSVAAGADITDLLQAS